MEYVNLPIVLITHFGKDGAEVLTERALGKCRAQPVPPRRRSVYGGFFLMQSSSGPDGRVPDGQTLLGLLANNHIECGSIRAQGSRPGQSAEVNAQRY